MNRQIQPRRRIALRRICALATVTLMAGIGRASEGEPPPVFLSDLARENLLTVRQGWGTLGLDTAAVPPDGRPPTPIRIGARTYSRGLGHHAAGSITVPLQPHHLRFCADAGVQWQGGSRGSVVLQVWVDGEKHFDSGTRSDSDPPVRIDVPLKGARELRLVATDNRDGIACDMATWADARLITDPNAPVTGPVTVDLDGRAAVHSAAVCGFSVLAADGGPQVAVMAPIRRLVACVNGGEEVRIVVPIASGHPASMRADARLSSGSKIEVALQCGTARVVRALATSAPVTLELALPAWEAGSVVQVRTRGRGEEAAVRWEHLRLTCGPDASRELPIGPPASGSAPAGAPAAVPDLRPAIAREMIEWDWRMQDGIGTARRPVNWQTAMARTIERGMRLAAGLQSRGVAARDVESRGRVLRDELTRLSAMTHVGEDAWEDLWRRVHEWRRAALTRDAWPDAGPIAFVKQVPGVFSHQLTQYYGACARPGGGLCVLDAPGRSLSGRTLAAGALPPGSFQHLDVSTDGGRLLFAYCRADTVPENREAHPERTYHLYEMAADGSGPRPLTHGPFDDFCPRYLPDGRLVFLSTRRGGFHRCGRGPCPVYTLATADADGGNPRTLSFHETHEWDPAVMADGRIVYTRWDYVDRHAVYYQQLWSARPDGSDVRILYGNNTFNPVGIWEARPVPGSRRLMATAAAHHAMTAGSIILVDPAAGVDGPAPIARLTPDALFPESEVAVAPTGWRGDAGVADPPAIPEEQDRWPGHCYRSPWPLSETLFLAAYSFDPLIGEPAANPPNMFGLYLVDASGNKELLHRDLNLSSLWPIPLRPRPPAPLIPPATTPWAGSATPPPSVRAASGAGEGLFFLGDVRAAWPPLPDVPIRRLRIVQVLPKSTPHANEPPVGLANASPGKQVLGTVPVEADGSAWFRAPAGVPLHFQALDDLGRAVQTMRSVTYLQPGEVSGCVGCHEPRLHAPAPAGARLAMRRPPSYIEPAPDGSNPLSFPRLVQPVLDRHCARCHSGPEPRGGIDLTAEPDGAFTRAYAALARRVPFSAWSGGDFQKANSEPMTYPGRFGARASPLMEKLLAGHRGVSLDADDIARLTTWMDANALFYGTFDPADQARQRRGERIAGAAVQ